MEAHFPIEITIDVKWGDMDALQHVNNTVFFKYFESVRIAHLDMIQPMPQLAEKGFYPILAATSCSFIKPLKYPDAIRCASRISSIGRTSFVQEYRITDGSGDLAARGEGVVVLMEKRSNSKTAIPEYILSRIYEMQEELRPKAG